MHHLPPFFSVIIPTYNRSHIISSAIKSVIAQVYHNWELIIIDDGSKDNTKKVVERFEDPRIKYYYQKNTERSQARNNGIKLAKGQYICFLDSDDQYCTNHLQVFYDFILAHQHPVALLFSNPIVLNGNEEIQEKIAPFNENNTLAYILKNSIIPDRVCIHHQIFNSYQFNPAIHIGEDTILWSQITNSFPMYHVDEYTVKYLIHDDNSVNLKNNVYSHRLKGLLKLFNEPEIKKRLSRKLKNQLISVCYFGIARHYELKRSFFPMCYNTLMSVLYDINNLQTKSKLFMIYAFLRQKS
ncbi:MAG TPA: glycosyltransferase family 2 protein [Bacteroidia bacterium]|nr:glycosyltransferase family 2 protein [Bacteroidia bacterium]